MCGPKIKLSHDTILLVELVYTLPSTVLNFTALKGLGLSIFIVNEYTQTQTHK